MSSVRHRFASLWAVLFVVSLGVNLVAHKQKPVQFRAESSNVSLALQRGEGFSNPFSTGKSGPTAHVAPLYPFLHAAVCSIFGTGIPGALVIVAFTTLAWALQCALVQQFATLHAHPGAGMVAAFVLAGLPLSTQLFEWEAVFTGAAIAGSACLLSLILARHGGPLSGVALGALMAIGTLLNPSTIVLWTTWACLLVFKLGVRPSTKVLLPAAVVFLIPVGVWSVRNYFILGHFAFVRDNMGLELAVSYNDCASALMSRNILSGCHGRFHPNENPKIERALAAEGEYQFNAMSEARAIAWIRAHPVRSIRLTAGHVLLFWFPIDLRSKVALMNGIVISLFTVLSFLGIVWRRSDGFQIAVTGLLSYSLVYYLVHFDQRYRYPVLWISVLLASIGIERWIAAFHFSRYVAKIFRSRSKNPADLLV